jgi:O-Antigen ligase
MPRGMFSPATYRRRSVAKSRDMLPRFSDNLRRTIIVLGVGLLFMPKVNIVSISGESAGIRIDDVLLLVIFALFLAGVSLARKPQINDIESIVFILIGFMLLSNLLNLLMFGRSSLLYSLRYVEYFMFFYIGQYFFDARYSVARLLYAMLLFNAILMVLQGFSIIGGFTSVEGFQQSVRPIGVTAGPYEIGAILNFSLAVFLFDRYELGGLRLRIFLIACTSVLVVFTGRRMPALAHMFLISYFCYLHSTNKTYFLRNAAFVGGLLLVAIFLIPNPLTERSENLFSIANIAQFKDQYANASVPGENFEGWPDTFEDETTDLSWLTRVTRWIIAIKTWTNSPLGWFVGVGPGNWGPALDGGWLRVMSEWGFFGFSIFLVFLYRIARISRAMFAVVVALAINMLFIDIHIAYKAMSLFFFLSGYAYNKERANPERVNQSSGHRGSFAHAGEISGR